MLQGKTSTFGRNAILNETANTNHSIGINGNVSFFEGGEVSAQEEDIDVPEVIEDIIEMLLSGLRDTVR